MSDAALTAEIGGTQAPRALTEARQATGGPARRAEKAQPRECRSQRPTDRHLTFLSRPRCLGRCAVALRRVGAGAAAEAQRPVHEASEPAQPIKTASRGGGIAVASRADVGGRPDGAAVRGASGRDIALRHFRAAMLVSIVLILFQFT